MKSLKISPLPPDIKAEVTITGSKSYTNRALLIAAMTPGPVRLRNPLLSDDTQAMIACLQILGIEIVVKHGYIVVHGDIRAITPRDYELDVNLSGTTLRFLLALAAVVPGVQTLRGGPGLQARPIGPLVTTLVKLGAKIEYLEREGYPPLRVTSSTLLPGTVRLAGGQSSQYLSALLMVAPLVGDLTITISGTLVSRPFVEMTIDTMQQFGVNTVMSGKSYSIAARQHYAGTAYLVEGDVSGACYFFAIATLNKLTITVTGLNPESLQADMGFLKILEQMGSKVSYSPSSITVTGTGARPVTVNMQDCPDQAQTLAVLAAFAHGKTTISGIQSLRIKETERIQALEQELKKMNIQTASTPDTLVIHGGKPRPASIATYGDHRMAMSFAVASTKLAGMEIQDPDVVTKTFPNFWQKLASLNCLAASERNIVLIGMRGSGKTTTARILAQKLSREHIDLDDIMIKKTGLATAALVEQYGWEYFRNEESAIAQETASMKRKVISTGGGIILRPNNIAALKANGYVILLQASADALAKRLGDLTDRPRLTAQKTLYAEIKQVMQERQKLYEAAADAIIDTDALKPGQAVKRILDLIKEPAT